MIFSIDEACASAQVSLDVQILRRHLGVADLQAGHLPEKAPEMVRSHPSLPRRDERIGLAAPEGSDQHEVGVLVAEVVFLFDGRDERRRQDVRD